MKDWLVHSPHNAKVVGLNPDCVLALWSLQILKVAHIPKTCMSRKMGTDAHP